MDSITTSCLATSDWISIADIIVTSILGLWIAVAVQRNLTTKRALKDHLICECKDIRELYKNFLNNLLAHKQSASYIKEWFQIMSIRIEILELNLQNEYRISAGLLKNHNEFKYCLTDTEDFNIQYSKPTITFSPENRNNILRNHKEFMLLANQNIILINKARKRLFVLPRK
jgi:hypothetical protein